MEVAVTDSQLPPEVVDLINERRKTEAWRQLDELDVALSKCDQAAFREVYQHTPGIVSKTLFMPANTVLTSKIHVVDNQFVISQGSVLVRDDDGNWEMLAAPHLGVTKAGTRRVLYTLEDTLWTTFHATDTSDPEEYTKEVHFDHTKLGHLNEVPADKIKYLEQ